MKIPIWKCSDCKDYQCILIRCYDVPTPYYCTYASKCTWESEEMDINEFVEYIRIHSDNKIGEHFHLIEGCKLQRGICPKTSNGKCDCTCEVIKRVNRS